ncbi:MAG: hypothetical protein ACI8ZF_000533 [Candidatus Midichloriaceae bacterium]|jgi:hypothetical protein
MSIKGGIIKEFAEEIESLGGLFYEIESYELEPYWKMTNEQEQNYNFGFGATEEELKDFFLKNKRTGEIFEYVFKGVIASGALKNFESVIRFTPYEYVKEILSTIIKVCHDKGVKEESTLSMIKTILQDVPKEHSKEVLKKIMSGNEAGDAASYGYYEIAKYLLTFDEQNKPLNGYDLYNIEDNSNNYFAGFKWMIEQGVGYEKSMIGKMLCQDKLPNMYKIEVFNNEGKVDETIEFLKNIGLTNDEKVSHILSKCEMVAKAVHPYSLNKPFGIDAAYFRKIIIEEPVEEVEFLFDHLNLKEDLRVSNTLFYTVYFISEVERAELLMNYLIKSKSKFSGQNIAYKLVNHPEAGIVSSIINKMREAEIPIREEYDEDYIKYTKHKMEKSMENCESNKLIAEYMEIENQMNWNVCVNAHANDDL